MKRIRFIVLFGLLSTWSHAQTGLYLSNFSVSEVGGHILISWTTSSGFTCEDIQVEHSIDSQKYATIYTYPGICGSDTTEEHYTFIFRDFEYSGVHYFRINLGRFGVSETIPIRITKINPAKPQANPNPATLESRLFFSNPERKVAQIQLYNVLGHNVGAIYETRQNSVSLVHFSDLLSGTYYFTVEIDGIRTTGKFIFL